MALSFSSAFLSFCLGIALLGCGSGSNGTIAEETEKIDSSAAVLRVLILGQSMASNCNEHLFGPYPGVFQIALSGEEKPAVDPFEWADCKQGSMWMPLGRNLLEAKVSTRVVFMPIGVSGSKVQDWQSGGSAFQKLNSAIVLINKKNITFDFAIWHQGSADNGMPGQDYKDRLSAVVDYVNSKVSVKRWLIGVHSRCWGQYDRNIESAQLEFGNSPSNSRFVGANTNLLGDEYRIDTCHLNEDGQEKAGAMWLSAVQAALDIKNR